MSLPRSVALENRAPVLDTHPVLTRDLLSSGEAIALARRDAPGEVLTSDAELEQSLAQFMATLPPGDLWTFAYGSLIWNPSMRVAESRIARVNGWHRSFCLSAPVGRGTPDAPGLVLGLEAGGTCLGLAYRIAEDDIGTELPILWRREMLVGGYRPFWTDAATDLGSEAGAGGCEGPVRALTFVADMRHPHCAEALARGEMIRRLATAGGSWGSSADYLFRTISGLQARGIEDPALERIGAEVQDLLDAVPDSPRQGT